MFRHHDDDKSLHFFSAVCDVATIKARVGRYIQALLDQCALIFLMETLNQSERKQKTRANLNFGQFHLSFHWCALNFSYYKEIGQLLKNLTQPAKIDSNKK